MELSGIFKMREIKTFLCIKRMIQEREKLVRQEKITKHFSKFFHHKAEYMHTTTGR
jgi:hypothetical protein